jgi:hypothetical protein
MSVHAGPSSFIWNFPIRSAVFAGFSDFAWNGDHARIVGSDFAQACNLARLPLVRFSFLNGILALAQVSARRALRISLTCPCGVGRQREPWVPRFCVGHGYPHGKFTCFKSGTQTFATATASRIKPPRIARLRGFLRTPVSRETFLLGERSRQGVFSQAREARDVRQSHRQHPEYGGSRRTTLKP